MKALSNHVSAPKVWAERSTLRRNEAGSFVRPKMVLSRPMLAQQNRSI